MSPATPIRNSVWCARIFRAVSAGLPRTMRRAKMPKLTATTVTNEIGKASAAILAAVRCDSSIVLNVISFPPKRSGAAGCQALLFDSKVITTFPRACRSSRYRMASGMLDGLLRCNAPPRLHTKNQVTEADDQRRLTQCHSFIVIVQEDTSIVELYAPWQR